MTLVSKMQPGKLQRIAEAEGYSDRDAMLRELIDRHKTIEEVLFYLRQRGHDISRSALRGRYVALGYAPVHVYQWQLVKD